jgi:hypothetical protein
MSAAPIHIHQNTRLVLIDNIHPGLAHTSDEHLSKKLHTRNSIRENEKFPTHGCDRIQGFLVPLPCRGLDLLLQAVNMLFNLRLAPGSGLNARLPVAASQYGR